MRISIHLLAALAKPCLETTASIRFEHLSEANHQQEACNRAAEDCTDCGNGNGCRQWQACGGTDTSLTAVIDL